MPLLSAYARAGLSSGSISSSSTGPADCGAGLLGKLSGQIYSCLDIAILWGFKIRRLFAFSVLVNSVFCSNEW